MSSNEQAAPTTEGAGEPPAQNPLHYAYVGDIDEFESMLGKFERGEISFADFRYFRLGRGTYGQRQKEPGTQMLRIKIPQGVLSADALETVADVTEEYSHGLGHVTTRQNIQLHFVKLFQVPEVMRKLAAAGLTTKEACGNTVRNITACPLAGVCNGAPFDVTPYGQATTRYFLRNPICLHLPRKFKIAFSGCEDDCAQGAINDVGLIAQVRTIDGQEVRGFRMRVGGALSTTPEPAHLLYEFLPADELLPTIEAIVRVFGRTGNRTNKSRARLKWVLRKIGWEGFVAEFEKELAAVRAEGRAKVPIDGEAPTIPVQKLVRRERGERGPMRPDYFKWRLHNVITQRQPGLYAVVVRLIRGDMTPAQMRTLARLAREYSDGTLRTTNDQNVILRNVLDAELSRLHAELEDINLGRAGARTLSDVIACPGASTCNLAVTNSRELSAALTERLEREDAAALVTAAQDLDIKISGCPNSCGQHHVAGFGFHGTMRRIGGQVAPYYELHLGGGISGKDGAQFGRKLVKLPAQRVPEAVMRLLALYQAERQEGEAARAFFQRVEEEKVQTALADLVGIDEATAQPEDFIDVGQSEPFVVEIGQGECAA